MQSTNQRIRFCILAICSSLLISSCGQERASESSNLDFNVSVDTIYIPVNGNRIQAIDIFEFLDNIFVAIKPFSVDSIFMYSYTNLGVKLVQRVGVDTNCRKYGAIVSICGINDTSIAILHSNCLSTINTLSGVCTSIFTHCTDSSEFCLLAEPIPMRYNSITKEVIVQYIAEGVNTVNGYKPSQIKMSAVIHLASGKLRVLPFTYNELFDIPENRTIVASPMLFIAKHGFGCGTTVSPELTIEDSEASLKHIVSDSPLLTQSIKYDVENIDIDMLMKAFKGSFSYAGIVYNAHSDCYYRVCRLPLPERDEEGLFTTTSESDYAIEVLDPDFSCLGYIILEHDHLFPNSWFTYGDYVYGIQTEKNQSYAKILRIQIKI